MSTPPTGNLGMGFSPMGFSIFGFGVPATAGTLTGSLLEQTPNGVSADARQIDPYTRDYNINENGLVQGQTSISQQVFLAIMTTFGTSVQGSLGSQFNTIKTFDASTFQSKINDTVNKALSVLVKSKQIKIVSVIASQNVNGVAGNITINWIDLTTNTLNQTQLQA